MYRALTLGSFLEQTIAARHPLLDQSLVESAILYGLTNTKKTLVESKLVSQDWIEKYAIDGDKYVREAILQSSRASLSMLETAVNDTSKIVKIAALGNPKCPLRMLEELEIYETDKDVLIAAISNPSCSQSLMRKLWQHPGLQLSILSSLNCPQDILESISAKYHLSVALANPKYPVRLMAKHISSQYLETSLAKAILSNPSCPIPVLEKSLQNPDFIEYALINSTIPVEKLYWYWTDTNKYSRYNYAIVSNQNCPLDLLQLGLCCIASNRVLTLKALHHPKIGDVQLKLLYMLNQELNNQEISLAIYLHRNADDFLRYASLKNLEQKFDL